MVYLFSGPDTKMPTIGNQQRWRRLVSSCCPSEEHGTPVSPIHTRNYSQCAVERRPYVPRVAAAGRNFTASKLILQIVECRWLSCSRQSSLYFRIVYLQNWMLATTILVFWYKIVKESPECKLLLHNTNLEWRLYLATLNIITWSV
jgi:hypothetical protein